MDRRKYFWWLLLVVIIATFLRLYQLDAAPPGLYPDEAMNGNNALEALRTGEWRTYYPENNGREGLFINIQALSLLAFGKNEPWVLRLPSALFGILTVLGLYFLAKELWNARVGLLASFLLATSFWHIIFSRIGFRAIMAPLLAVWGFYFFLKAVRMRGAPISIFSALAGGAIYGLGFYTYIAYRVTPLLVLFMLMYFWRESGAGIWRKQFLLSTLYFLLSAFLVALPIGLYYLSHPADFFGRTAELSIFSSQTPLKDLVGNTLKTAGMFNVAGDFNWRHNFAGRPELFWPVGMLFLIGIFAGSRTIWGKSRLRAALRPSGHGSPQGESEAEAPAKIRAGDLSGNADEIFPFSLVFFWLILAALPVVVSNEGLPHALRAILMIPPVFILAAVGGVSLYDRLRPALPKIILLPTLYLLLSFLVAHAYTMYFIRWAGNPKTANAFAADYVWLGENLNRMRQDTPKYVVVPEGGVLVRGIPMPSQTVMFITDTFDPEDRKDKNIHYILPADENKIPSGAIKFHLK
ncbi:MAG: hypothetical protein A3A43_00025 [Candidatus Liptonbacteria bacterium RIFCSPLOWO2_01_FULL_56_20]|uniref:Glycosyltransferase RgtA/B/C/D-like domain-containing protein n=1 Tax=Candidatus Liptonbacteria bacterium RIFCSPLOWO2_01_FULL_56_20 TaxID=1798652 RepID=A0A1G2CK39_9BACT|nr:MAG: hypothetical protein A2681_02355 [Candidatus Liptonbacteria bacterium RIFCSPHIGHO2_01_FULL_56_18b]OGZ01773.1 MAG: hypothetical protein A3A43_00025 [Candidatus Liptonbacteria bacterium RIFCSPLOWO2_01_FULL_56_20]